MEDPLIRVKKESTELSAIDSFFSNKISYFSSEQNHKMDKTRDVMQIDQFNLKKPTQVVEN